MWSGLSPTGVHTYGASISRAVLTTKHLHASNKMRDTYNVLTRWAMALQHYDFPLKHVPSKFNVVPDMLSRVFSEVTGESITSKPRLAAICRNVPIDGPYYLPGRREYEPCASNLHDVAPVESDRKILLSAVSVFFTVDPAKLVDLQKEAFCPYFVYLRTLTSAPLPNRESKFAR